MIEASKAKNPKPTPKDRLIVALDVETAAEADEIISEIGGEVGAFKIGLQLFTSAGPEFVRKITESGVKVFLDLKFHDIPNTVAKASVEASRLGVWMLNVHALGGSEMMRRAAAEVDEVCVRENLQRPKIIAVTILTSSNNDTLQEIGIDRQVSSEVLHLAELVSKCGLDGVVSSPLEVKTIREAISDPQFLIVTPGIRPISGTNEDQQRVMTPGQAIATGSDHIVVGRPITRASDRLSAVHRILEEIKDAS